MSNYFKIPSLTATGCHICAQRWDGADGLSPCSPFLSDRERICTQALKRQPYIVSVWRGPWDHEVHSSLCLVSVRKAVSSHLSERVGKESKGQGGWQSVCRDCIVSQSICSFHPCDSGASQRQHFSCHFPEL